MLTSIPDGRLLIDQVLTDALARRASDIHLEPGADGYEIRMRVDGILITHSSVPQDHGRAMVVRLMVMAQLLTYRLDIPQEGRFELPALGGAGALAARVAIMPTAKGLRAVVRMPADLLQPKTPADLGLPANVLGALLRFTQQDSGMLIVTGPAGSGKTTTIYALLGAIATAHPGSSIISLEDPVERSLPGVTQIEVSPHGELTYERALRSILRQDPQILVLGEIRDAATASLAVQAALTGHRLICTFHASTPAGAVARLLEMGIEPYQITSSIFGVMTQRLLRKRNPAGGYLGRVPVAEFCMIDAAAREAIAGRRDAAALQKIFAQQEGYVSMAGHAAELRLRGMTDEDEIVRILGP